MALLTGQVRRILSIEAVRSQARLLLHIIGAVGVGVGEAEKRRVMAGMEERKLYRERKAIEMCGVT